MVSCFVLLFLRVQSAVNRSYRMIFQNPVKHSTTCDARLVTLGLRFPCYSLIACFYTVDSSIHYALRCAHEDVPLRRRQADHRLFTHAYMHTNSCANRHASRRVFVHQAVLSSRGGAEGFAWQRTVPGRYSFASPLPHLHILITGSPIPSPFKYLANTTYIAPPFSLSMPPFDRTAYLCIPQWPDPRSHRPSAYP